MSGILIIAKNMFLPRKEDALFEISPATAPGLKFGLPSEA
jgi:hypothetical protein